MKQRTGRIIPLMLIVLLTGCWERTEVNDIGIVTATGLDLLNNGDYRLSLLVAIPRLIGNSSSGSGGGESKLEASGGWVVSEQGRTVLEAYRNIQAKIPRRIFFSQNRIIVISEKLARSGVMPILDFFERNRQSQLNSYLLISKQEANQVLEFPPKFEKLASEVLKEELKNGVGVSVRLGRFLTMLMDEGEEPYAPQVAFTTANKGSKSQDQKTLNIVATKATGVFRKDRLIGWLNDKETRGLKWMRNISTEGVVTIAVPDDLGGGFISAEMGHVRTRTKPVLQGENVKIKLTVNANLNISENSSKLDLNNVAMLKQVTGMFEDVIAERLKLTCRKAQKELAADIFGFGQLIYREHPYTWRKQYASKWDKIFPNLEVSITPNVMLIHTGLVGKDYKWEDKP